MTVKRGESVLVRVYFSSGTGNKVRPALVVQSDHNNQRLQDTIVALITRTTRRAMAEATQLLVDVASVEGKQTGLLTTSAIKCEHLSTVLQMDVQRTVGSLTPALMKQIDTCLKVSLDLP